MDRVELLRLVARGESPHVDFKAAFPSHREFAKDLVCFANTDGGRILFGVDDDGRMTGVPDVDDLMLKVDEVAHEHCEPPVTAVVETVDVGGDVSGGAAVVVVSVPKGDARPYRTKRGQYFVRAGTRCRAASREELLRLFQATESLYDDETPLYRTSFADVDVGAVETHVKRVGLADVDGDEQDLRVLLRNWRLYDGRHLTLAGAVLFARDPQRELPYAQINAARFPGGDSGVDPADRTDLTGRLFDVIAAAGRWLDVHLMTPHRVRGFDPEPQPELPAEALREAVVNAVAHRDYTIRGPVRLFVFDDRVEVHTPGRAPNSVDEAAMRAGVHVVRNPHVYARLAEAGLVTRAGTGIRRMSRLVREATGRDVGIDLRDFEVLVTLPRRAQVDDVSGIHAY